MRPANLPNSGAVTATISGPTEIAKAQQCSAPMVTRDLDNLLTAGLAEVVPETGRWRLTPVLIQLSFKYMANVERAEKKLAETQNRYTRS